MIEEINQMNIKLLSDGQIISSKLQESDLQNKDVLLALSKIQIGDLISGKIILENNQSMIKLESGLTLLAQLSHATVSDQFLDFKVIAKGRQHLELEQVQVSNVSQSKTGVEEAVMKEMQLPNTSEMKQVVGQWMEQQLPLIKNQLLQVYHLAKNYELPTEALVKLNENAVPLSEQEIQCVAQFKKQGMQMVDCMLEDACKAMKPSELVELAVSLGQSLSKDTWIQTVMSHISDLKATSLEHGREPLSEGVTTHQSVPHEVNDVTMQPDVKGYLGEAAVELQTEWIESSLQKLPKENLRALVKTVVHQYLTVHSEELLQKPNELAKLDGISIRLGQLIEKVKEQVEDDVKYPSMQQLEQVAESLDKFSTNGQYFCFPLQINEHQTSGELYFYKPKKHKKGSHKSEGMYIVLALQMPALKRIEIHLSEEKETLGLKIKVINEDIQKQIEAHEKKLRTLMEETMMPIRTITVECTHEKQNETVSTKQNTINRLDFRV